MSADSFGGFLPQTVEFFRQLARHNSREWFDRHRPDYENFVLHPAQSFVRAMGQRLRQFYPQMQADPRVNGSIFRIFRDTRFSPDKTPYKTHLGIYFWEGGGPKLANSGFYFHLEPPDLFLGAGMYIFPPTQLRLYRRVAADPEYGQELADIVTHIASKKGYALGGLHYKRVPAGVPADHPRPDLLRHNGLFASCESKIPKELFSEKIVDYCWEKFDHMAALHEWLVSMNGGEFSL